MFSHPPADRPGPVEPVVPGDPALDDRWRAATAGWRPSSIRPSSVRTGEPDRVRAWVRHAWEDLDGPTARTGDDDDALARRVRDLMTVAALFVLQERFLAVAAGEPVPAEAPDPRGDGAPLDDDEVLAVVRQTWDVDPAEEGTDGFAAELAGFLQDHLDELAEEVRERLVDRRGPTQVFAELWSLEHVDELEPADEEGRPPFPLSTDDIAWIVSGVPGPEKHAAWEWLVR
ncbi:hypothetical protein [Kocuria sp. NPDC057446]|uniref:hypothetical protein n=1 Tax=Kocuria sp. NPDC057446 TaxID=3346137 RepID=UPI00369D8A24